MVQPRIQVDTNRRRTRASLRQFERDYERQVIVRVLPRWRNIVVARAKRTRSFRDRTGNLRRQMFGRVRRADVSVGFSSGARSRDRRRSPYWFFLERGTRYIRARRFFRTAIRRSRMDLIRLLQMATEGR